MRRARLSFLLIACFLFAVAAPARVKAQEQKTPASGLKQREAERLVIRAVERFGQTLDFNDIYREMYISDGGVRKSWIESLLRGIVDEMILRKLKPELLEKAFVTVHNVFSLAFVCALAEQKSIYILEREIVGGFNPRQYDFFKRLNGGESNFIDSEKEFLELLSFGDFIVTTLRGRITNEFRQKMLSKTTIETSKVMSAAQQDKILSKYGDTYDISVKIDARLLRLQFTVIEESGAMKILCVMIDDD